MTPEDLALSIADAITTPPGVRGNYVCAWPADGATVDVEVTTPDSDGAGGLRFRITVEERQ